MFNPFSAGTVSIPQNLTSVDFRFLMHRDSPRTERIKVYLMAFAHNIGIQMNQKELTFYW